MATVRNINRLIDAVLKDILHVYRMDETVSNDDKQTLLYAIQDRLAAWADDIIIPVVATESLSMVSGTATYTIGESGSPSLNTARPDKVVGAYVREGDYDYPVGIISEAVYRTITDKSSTGRPEKLYPLYGTPNVTIYLWPVPDSTDTLYVVLQQIMTEPTTYTQDTFATLGLPGYIYNALKWRVAIDIAPGFERQLTQEILWNANDAYANMTSKHLARNMRGALVEMGLTGRRGSYSLSDFFAGK